MLKKAGCRIHKSINRFLRMKIRIGMISIMLCSSSCYAPSRDHFGNVYGLEKVAAGKLEYSSPTNYFFVVNDLERTYNLFISFEFHPDSSKFAINGIAPNSETPREDWLISPSSIKKGAILDMALSNYCKATDQRYTYKEIGDTICLYPERNTSSKKTIMDEYVEFGCSGLSPDEALKALFKTTCEQYGDIDLEWAYHTHQMGNWMPQDMYDSKCISIPATRDTLRNLLCNIFKQSPIWLYYHFHPPIGDKDSIIFIGTNPKRPDLIYK